MLEKRRNLIETLSKYILVQIELIRLGVRQKIELQVVRLLYMAVLAVVGLSFLNFLLILLAVFINKHLQSPYLGFLFITAALLTIFLTTLIIADYAKSRIRKLLLLVLKAKK